MRKRILPILACLIGYGGGIWSVAQSLPKGFEENDLLWIGLAAFLLAVLSFPELVRVRAEDRSILFDGLILTSIAAALTASALVFFAVGLKGHYFSDLTLLPFVAFFLAWLATLPLVFGIPALRRLLPETRVAWLSRRLGRWDTGHLAIALVPLLTWGAALARHSLLDSNHRALKAATFRSLDSVRASLEEEIRRFPNAHDAAVAKFLSASPSDPASALAMCAESSNGILGCSLVESSGKYLVANRHENAKCGLCALGECALEKNERGFEIRSAVLPEHLLPDLSTNVPRFLPATAIGGSGCEEIARLVPLAGERGSLLVSLSLSDLSKDFIATLEKVKVRRGRAVVTDTNGTIVASSDGTHLVKSGKETSLCRTIAECGIPAGNVRMSALDMLRRGRPHSSITIIPSAIWLISSSDLATADRPPWLLTVLSELEVPP